MGAISKRERRKEVAPQKSIKTKRKYAAITPMTRQRSSDIPDILIYYDRYEFCSVEAGKTENNDTKEENDSSKLAVTCKQMLLNLSHHATPLQRELRIVGMNISSVKLSVYELSNPNGMVCVNTKTDELYFTVRMLEWRKKMFELYERWWTVRLEAEERFRAVCTSSGGSVPCKLQPCFQKYQWFIYMSVT